MGTRKESKPALADLRSEQGGQEDRAAREISVSAPADLTLVAFFFHGCNKLIYNDLWNKPRTVGIFLLT